MKRWFQFFKQKAYEFRWALLAGVLVGTSYIPFPPWALLFCYTPLWLVVIEDCKNLKQAFWHGWVTQFVLSLIGFHWIAYTAHEFGALPWSVSILAMLLFCAFMHVYIALAPVFALWARAKFKLSAVQTLFVIALTHALLERIWPAIFQWNLGYPLFWAKLPVYQLADLIGFEGLSAIILLFNAWMAVVWLKQNFIKKALSQLAILMLTFASLVAWGIWHGQDWNSFDRQTRALVVQANIGNMEKIMAENGAGFQEEIIHRFLRLSAEGLQKNPQADVLIWPETAFPDYLDQHYLGRKHVTLLTEGLKAFDRPLITGAYSKDEMTDPNIDRSSYNALFLIDPVGNNIDKPYRKTELLAFGEYLPLSERFPFLLKLFPFVSNFGRGPGPSVIKWPHNGDVVNWGGQICYEGLYPEFSRGLANKDADIIVNVTNDSWFGSTSEPNQHLYMTLARAIEVRRPLVRSTNTGISTAVLANGQVLEKSPLHREWAGEFVIRYKKSAPHTVYVRFGHWDWIILLAALIVILLRGFYDARARRS